VSGNDIWIALECATLCIWLYLLAGRGGFWLFREPAPPPAPRVPPPRIAVIIPARNEAAVVGEAVASLLRQRYAGEWRIIVVDDASTDGTADAALAAATDAEAARRLKVCRAGRLPPGWTGKLWAQAEGIRQAARQDPEFLLLTDADIAHGPDNLAQLAARAQAGGYDLVSYMALLRTGTRAEKLLIPAFVFFFFLLYPPAWVARPRRRTAGAAGGCMLVRRAALERAGGLEAIRSEVIDDCSLARAIKRSGGSVWLGLSCQTRSLRGHGSAAGIGRMISRSAFAQLRHSAWLLAATLAGLALTFVAPAAGLASFRPLPAALGALAWALLSFAYAPALRYYGISRAWAPLLPAIAVYYGAATVHSGVMYWRGRGGEWKGRRQDARGAA
jgi:hopene-associated glycosyltransferase HpnB